MRGEGFRAGSAHLWLFKVYDLSRKAKKAEGLEQHKKLQREKDQKRKDRKQVSLPSKHAKNK
jgi:hypothetical protein